MRKLYALFALLVTLFLSACGGGGGYSGVLTPANQLRMTPLISGLTLPMGYATDSVTLSQGVRPYYVWTNSDAATAVLGADDVVRVYGNKVGTATVTMQDSSVNQGTLTFTVNVTAYASEPLKISTSKTLNLISGRTQTVQVWGGTAPYSWTTTDSSVASITNSTMSSFDIVAGMNGTATITVTDKAGTTIDISVTVTGGALRTSAADAVTMRPGTSSSVQIQGGLPGYTVTSNNTSVVAIQTTGTNGFVMNALLPGTATVTVLDSVGGKVTIAVTVSTAALASSIGTAVTLLPGNGIDFTVSGGMTPYTVASANPGVASVVATGSGQYLITANAPGTANIIVRDAVGGTLTIAVTVSGTALASSVGTAMTLRPGLAQSVSITGGSAPYTLANTNQTVVQASPTTASASPYNFTVTGLSPGSSNLVVTDKFGATVTIAVTVTSPSALLASPSAGSGASLTTLNIFVSGGVEPYTVLSSNPTIATATIAGNVMAVALGLPGSTTLIVRDSQGAQIQVPITVTDSVVTPPTYSTQIQAVPAVQGISEGSTQPVTYGTINGLPVSVAVPAADAFLVNVAISGSNVIATPTGRCITADRTINISIAGSSGQTATAQLVIFNNPSATCIP